MIDGREIVGALESLREDGADRDRLLREAVRRVEGSESHYDWVGIYLLEGEELVLHNYIGRPTDHVRIPVGRGVCGTAVAEGRDVNVPDVTEAEEYLACSAETRSELVVLIQGSELHGQIDLDSDDLDAFSERDHQEIRRVADWLAALF
jgi:GAF domain-containing protein